MLQAGDQVVGAEFPVPRDGLIAKSRCRGGIASGLCCQRGHGGALGSQERAFLFARGVARGLRFRSRTGVFALPVGQQRRDPPRFGHAQLVA